MVSVMVECGRCTSLTCLRLQPAPLKTRSRVNFKKIKHSWMQLQKERLDSSYFSSTIKTDTWVCACFVLCCCFLCKCEGTQESRVLQQSKQSKPHASGSLSEPCIAERLWLRFLLLWFNIYHISTHWWESDEAPVYAASTHWNLLVWFSPHIY